MEALAQCPARVGGRLKMEPAAFLRWLREQSLPRERADVEDVADRFLVGVYADRDRPGLGETLAALHREGARG